MKNKTKRFVIGGIVLFVIFIMVASVMTIGLGGNDNDKESKQQGSLQDTLCEVADYPIVNDGEVYEPCEEGMYEGCWDCINNRITIT